MPYKNDNLEELFKKAANDYPLRTDNSNWDSVATKLNNQFTENVAGKSNAWKYAAILIFLLAGGTFIYLFQSTRQAATKAELIQTKTSNPVQQKSVQQLTDNNAASITESNKNIEVTSGDNFKKTLLNNKNIRYNTERYSLLNESNQFNPSSNNSVSGSTTTSSNLSGNLSSIETKEQAGFTSNLNKPANDEASLSNENSDNANAENSSLQSQQDMVSYQSPKAKFYGSLFGCPQFSIIKSQRILKPGYRLGIALAFRMTNHFDIELGAQREHINYFTSGQYFDKSVLKLKDQVSLEDLTANSTFTVVPITLRYNFQSKSSGHFYAGAGFNALVLTHSEKYHYTTVAQNGSSDDKSKNYKSITSAKYFTSINTSAGYQNKLCNWCDYKVESYYQLPVTKLGIGKLPISSFGINVGIVKDLK